MAKHSRRFVQGRLLLWVAIGSALGGIARYVIQEVVPAGRMPWATLAVNVAGCFLLAFLLYFGTSHGWWSPEVRAFLGVGFFGGFTTMSAFALEVVGEAAARSQKWALAYVVTTLVFCLGGAALGRQAGLAA